MSTRKELKRLALRLKDIAEGEGDLTKKLEADGKGEIEEVVHWYNRFVENYMLFYWILTGLPGN
jgi:methyl-accepting chemotaxis protein